MYSIIKKGLTLHEASTPLMVAPPLAVLPKRPGFSPNLSLPLAGFLEIVDGYLLRCTDPFHSSKGFLSQLCPCKSPYPASLCVRIGPWCGNFFILSCSLALRLSRVASLKFGLVPNLNGHKVQWSKVGSHALTSLGDPPVQSRHFARIAFKGDMPLTPFPNRSGQTGHDLSDRHNRISCGWSRQHQQHFIRIASKGVLIAIYPILRR
jgi:hypothetical protein